jgi:hypothetical protein
MYFTYWPANELIVIQNFHGDPKKYLRAALAWRITHLEGKLTMT